MRQPGLQLRGAVDIAQHLRVGHLQGDKLRIGDDVAQGILPFLVYRFQQRQAGPVIKGCQGMETLLGNGNHAQPLAGVPQAADERLGQAGQGQNNVQVADDRQLQRSVMYMADPLFRQEGLETPAPEGTGYGTYTALAPDLVVECDDNVTGLPPVPGYVPPLQKLHLPLTTTGNLMTQVLCI